MSYYKKNFDLINTRQSAMKYQVKKLPKAGKLMHYLLTSPELGYKRVELECYLETNKSVDAYIHDIGLAIELDGPPHFFSNTGEHKISLQDRKTDRELAPLRLNFILFDPYCKPSVDFTEFTEEDFSSIKAHLKSLIDYHISQN